MNEWMERFFSPASEDSSSSSDCGVCLRLQLTLRSTGLLKAVLFKTKSPSRADECRSSRFSADSPAPGLQDAAVMFTCSSSLCSSALVQNWRSVSVLHGMINH